MRTFVISLRGSAERRRAIRERLHAVGAGYSFFEAVDPRRDRNRYFHHCDDDEFFLNTGRKPTSGELGCYASHLLLWRTCRLLDEPIAVLEDDVTVGEDFNDALDFVALHIRRLGFVRLQENDKTDEVPVVRGTDRRIFFGVRYPYGAAGYALSPKVADAFIRRSRVFREPVDVFIKRFWRHGQALYTLRPAAAMLGPHCRRTTIRHRQPKDLPPALAWKRWWHKRRDFVERARFNRRWLRERGLAGRLDYARQLLDGLRPG